MKRHNKVIAYMVFLLVCVLTGCAQKADEAATAVSSGDTLETKEPSDNAGQTEFIVHESADILYYENGYPYIHDILTNHTGSTITETEYCMLAYDADGMPLKLYWNFLDSNAECSYDCVVRTEDVNLLPGQTENYRGGWSLYEGEKMGDRLWVGEGEANQAAYSLFCLKEVAFEDGSVWSNPEYDDFLQTYAGRQTDVEALKSYYPYTYNLKADKGL